MWVDNFSKSYAVALQGIESGAWKDCNWTGRGIKVFCGTQVDIKIGDLTAMPDNLFTDDTMQLVRSKVAGHVTDGWRLLGKSIVKRYKVNNGHKTADFVALGFQDSDDDEDEEDHEE